MSEQCYAIQLYGGGNLDGTTLDIPTELHVSGVIRVPVPPSGADMFSAYESDDLGGPKVLLFTHDGTVNEQGYARYRCTS